MSSAPRVRFAPSPTGFLHIGGVRTALFNWLYARRLGGEFFVRIENTDTSREVEHATEHILADLAWLGLNWDGAVTYQMDRMDVHRAAAERLVAEGKAYYDDGAIRLKIPDAGEVVWHDLVKGEMRFANADIKAALRPRGDTSAPGDLVLVRADGRATYNFASPHDDVLDGITHVIRGDDHVSNTPKQIHVIRALGAEVPSYAHLPMVFDDAGKKMSKRSGATSLEELNARSDEPMVYLEEFRAAGYLPAALLNHLVLLGWSPGGEETVLALAEVTRRFSLDAVNPAPARFDYKRLEWMNGVYLRETPFADYEELLVSYLKETDFLPDGDAAKADLVRATAPLVHDKMTRLGEYPDFCRFLFTDVPPAPEADAVVAAAALLALSHVDPFDVAGVETALRALPEELGLKPRAVFRPLYAAVCGRPTGPSLFDSLPLLGREETLKRLRRVANQDLA
jgi:glutamyl-tRNA synthetase